MSEFPQKDFYKLSEVCQYTDTQPYVLRFWESEFPQLSPRQGGSGQRVYRKEDIDLVRRIKQLLYEEEYTLAGARQKLDDEGGKPRGAKAKAKVEDKAKRTEPRAADSAPRAVPGPSKAQASRRPAERLEPPARSVRPTAIPRQARMPTLPLEALEEDTVPRTRYEDAIDEIDHLRLQLKEADKRCRKAESHAEEASRLADDERRRAGRATERIERLLEELT